MLSAGEREGGESGQWKQIRDELCTDNFHRELNKLKRLVSVVSSV